MLSRVKELNNHFPVDVVRNCKNNRIDFFIVYNISPVGGPKIFRNAVLFANLLELFGIRVANCTDFNSAVNNSFKVLFSESKANNGCYKLAHNNLHSVAKATVKKHSKTIILYIYIHCNGESIKKVEKSIKHKFISRILLK
jgi:hypothetical protein